MSCWAPLKLGSSLASTTTYHGKVANPSLVRRSSIDNCSWYKRSEFGIRAAVFFSAATVSGAFGGLLAAAISKMDGIGGKAGWAWIFILEGLATVLAGIVSFWIIQDFPDTATFLTEEERTFVVRRLQADSQHSAAGEDLRWHYIWRSLLDWKTWVGSKYLSSGVSCAGWGGG